MNDIYKLTSTGSCEHGSYIHTKSAAGLLIQFVKEALQSCDFSPLKSRCLYADGEPARRRKNLTRLDS